MEHYFNIDIASDFGIEEAIVLHSIFFWLSKNASNNKHFYDGLYWLYNSKKAFVELFPYMNETKIFRVLKKLEEEGIIEKGNYSKDKWDKTNWYALTKKGIDYMVRKGYKNNDLQSVLQNDTMERSKMHDGACQNARCINNNYTDIDINKEKKEDTNVSPKKNDYKAIIDCWNEYNGKRLGKVTKITQRRKAAIKKALLDNDITQEQLMQFFKTLPFADSWLYNPNKQHKNWKPDFDWWLVNTNDWLTKGLEGKVHFENPQAYSSIICGDDAPYTPICEGSLSWNDYYKCYLYVGFWDGKFMPDGYTDENRPDGASVMLHNGRGTIVWCKEQKKWVEK